MLSITDVLAVLVTILSFFLPGWVLRLTVPFERIPLVSTVLRFIAPRLPSAPPPPLPPPLPPSSPSRTSDDIKDGSERIVLWALRLVQNVRMNLLCRQHNTKRLNLREGRR